MIFMPLTEKVYTTVTGFSDLTIAKSKETLGKADEVYLIGYRANDDIIKTMLGAVKANTWLHVVSAGSAETIQKKVLNWAPQLTAGRLWDTGFEAFVQEY